MIFTKHAKKRAAQRGVSEDICELLLDYGESLYRRGGGRFHFFSKKSIKKIEHKFGREFVSKNHEDLKAFCIEDHKTGRIVTIGKHYKKHPRQKKRRCQ